MVDAFLIILCIVFSGLSIVGCFYFIGMFETKQDRGVTPWYIWVSKAIITLGMASAVMNVMMLPLDTINRATGNTLRIDVMSWIFLFVALVLSFVGLPYIMRYIDLSEEAEYLDETEGHKSKCPVFIRAAFYSIAIVIFFAILLLILWFAVGKCRVPIEIEKSDGDKETEIEDGVFEIQPSPIVFVVAVVGLIGYVLFIIEGGIGVASLPFGLIRAFWNRARPLTAELYARAKVSLNEWAHQLVQDGEYLSEDVRRHGRDHRTTARRFNKFEVQVQALERAYNMVEVCHKDGGNPIWPWVGLILGIISAIISFTWVLHVIIFYASGAHPFLNKWFVAMDNAFPYATIIFFGIWIYFLFWCVIDGTATMGLNLFIIRVHPMERGKTPMISIVFNVILLIFASFGASLFATMMFSVYSRLTSMDMLYGVQMRYMKGMSYIWDYGVYAWLALIVIGVLWQLCTLKRSDRGVQIITEAFARREQPVVLRG